MSASPKMLGAVVFFLFLLNGTFPALSAAAAPQTTYEFSNPTPITIPDVGPGTPYPSSIDVSGLQGVIEKVTVTVRNLNHTFPTDLVILLVGPNGQNTMLMTGAGLGPPVTGLWLTFDDDATAAIPQAGLSSGTFRPANHFTAVSSPPPAPQAPYGKTLSVFEGTDPNGTWSLYAGDPFAEDMGSVASGWSLRLHLTGVSISIGDADILEGDTGSFLLDFPVELSSAHSQTVRVNFQTVDGSATGDSDYVPQSGALVFSPGNTRQTVSVLVVGDLMMEVNENFFVQLSNPINAALADDRAEGTILNDDVPPGGSDLFSDRGSFSAQRVTATISTMGASKEEGEPNHADNSGGMSVWWSWQAPTSGTVTLSTGGSDFDTLLAVYQGSALKDLKVLVSNDDYHGPSSKVSFNAISNSTYQIAVDGANGTSGTLLLTLKFEAGQFIPSHEPAESFWGTDGPVYALLATNGLVYLGGEFNYVFANNQGHGELFDTYTGAAEANFPRADGPITAAVSDGQNGWYVGGQFNRIGQLARQNLAHIRSDNSVDPAWQADTDGPVLSLAHAAGQLFVGGQFKTIGGQPRGSLGAVTDQGVVTLWNPLDPDQFIGIPPARAEIDSLVVSNNEVWFAGRFFRVGGQDRCNVAVVDIVTGTPAAWQAGFMEAQERVLSLALSTDVVYLGGTFTGIAGQSRNYLAALDRRTGQLLPWAPRPDGSVLALGLYCDRLIVGGGFNFIGGQPRVGLAALEIATGQPTSWDPQANDSVASLVVSDRTVYVGGEFTRIGGKDQSNLARIDLDHGFVLDWAPRADRFVRALALSHGRLLAGGEFPRGGAARKNLAALDARTGRLTAWNPIADAPVRALAAGENAIYLGGEFGAIAGQERNHLAAVDPATGILRSWNPGADGTVHAFLASEETLIVGGSFNYVGGESRHRLAAINMTTGQMSGWDPNVGSGEVRALARIDDTLYIGGSFTQVAGQPRRYIAAVDAVSGSLSPWSADGSVEFDEVYSLAVDETVLYVGTSFYYFLGPPTGLFAFDRTSGTRIQGLPVPDPEFPLGGVVNALLLNEKLLAVGGSFLEFAGVRQPNLAALDVEEPVSILPWIPDVNGEVTALAASDKMLYAGGTFTSVAQGFQPFLAAFPPLGAARLTSQPHSQIVAVGEPVTFEVRAAGQEPLVYQWRRNGTPLPGATTRTLSILEAEFADSGTYDLVVFNGLGQAHSRDIELIVTLPPTISLQPVSQTLLPGQTAILTASATGVPRPTYQWRLNGVNIPGAVFATYTISNIQPTNGGSYSVVVANVGGADRSQTATLRVATLNLPFADNFAELPVVASTPTVGSGSNAGATREVAEPNHVDKLGRTSVWLGWEAPFNGIATFTTRGSSFDTLLAVYTGPSLDQLELVAADEDRGGFLTSRVAFNSEAGTTYHIAVDGFAGAVGDIVLSWDLDVSQQPFPRIIVHPLSQSAMTNQSATFSVVVSSNPPGPKTYQWFFGCVSIPGATSDSLTIPNVRPEDVGAYRVLVMNESSQAAESFDANLEIGPEQHVVSRDKYQDLFPELLSGGVGAGRVRLAASVAQGYFSVPLGANASQLINNQWATTPDDEPLHCGVHGGASEWLRFRPESNGTFVFETFGSTIDTLLAAYQVTDLVTLDIVRLACDHNGGPGGRHSMIKFDAVPQADYLVVADGVGGAQGLISLNWVFGAVPLLGSNKPQLMQVHPGASVVLNLDITDGVPAAAYQWLWNGLLLAGATNRIWSVPEVDPAETGDYSLVASNFVGSVTSIVVTVSFPLLEFEAEANRGLLGVWVPAELGQAVELEVSWDLVNWMPMHVIEPGDPSRYFSWPLTNGTQGFLRAVPHQTVETEPSNSL